MSPRAPRRDFDPIRLVEAAYELHVDRATWLRGLIDALAPVLDDDCGIGAFEWSFDEQGALHAGEPVMVGCSAEVAAALGRAIAVMPPEEARAFFLSSRALLSLSDGVGWRGRFVEHPLTRSIGGPIDVPEALAFNVYQPGGPNIMVAAAHRKVVSSPKRSRRLKQCAAHVAAALRLRQKASADAIGQADAILEVDGRVAHLVGDAVRARHALGAAVERMHYARGPLRRSSPDEAIALWRALIAGRWSICDHVDGDGRRYMIARRNEHGVGDPRGLSLRERQVVALALRGDTFKEIAYELGLSSSMASRHLRAAMGKLGVTTRAELARVVRSGRGFPGGSEPGG